MNQRQPDQRKIGELLRNPNAERARRVDVTGERQQRRPHGHTRSQASAGVVVTSADAQIERHDEVVRSVVTPIAPDVRFAAREQVHLSEAAVDRHPDGLGARHRQRGAGYSRPRASDRPEGRRPTHRGAARFAR